MSKESLNPGKYLASPDEALIMLIDYQEKLLPHICGSTSVSHNASRLARFANIVSLPVIVTEQYPKGLGPTVTQLAALIGGNAAAFHKTTFSCMRNAAIAEAVKSSSKGRVIVAGIETHICVGQTVCDLLDEGYVVHVISDCVGSRSKLDHEVGLQKMHDAGAVISTLEAFIYEVLGSCEHPRFKQCLMQMLK